MPKLLCRLYKFLQAGIDDNNNADFTVIAIFQLFLRKKDKLEIGSSLNIILVSKYETKEDEHEGINNKVVLSVLKSGYMGR